MNYPAQQPPTFLGSDPQPQKSLRVVMIYGAMSSGGHVFDIANLYRSRGLTGSESSFFNLARGLSQRGHEVVVICDVAEPAQHSSGFQAMPLVTVEGLRHMPCDVVIAWNEPDYLQYAPPGALKLCDQQLNDFRYVRHPARHTLADVWVTPSQNHLDYLTQFEGMGIGGVRVIPNSVDLGIFDATCGGERNPHRVVYCSSPDRGLHHLLGMWPSVRLAVPDAELHIFYRLEPWLRAVEGAGPWNGAHPDVAEAGRRARFIAEALERLKDGWGVYVHGNVSNYEMAAELQTSGVLAYPCDPLRYTEGFGVSALDAAAAGCHVIITDADALPSTHGTYAKVIPGKPSENRLTWINAIVAAMHDSQPRPTIPEAYTMAAVSEQWETLILEQLAFRVPAQPQEVMPDFSSQPAFGQVLGVRRRLVTSRRGNDLATGSFRFWETAMHASWWSKEDEQVVRDRHWHPRAGDMVLDIGSAFGSYTLPALALGAYVVAFSPADMDTLLLEANVELNPDLAPRFMLTRDGIGGRDCWFDPDRSVFADEQGSTGQWMRVRALDSWLAEHPEVSRIDWIKMDIEGAELEALKGAEQCLRRWKPRLLIECHDFHRPMFAVVRDFVLGLGLGYTCEMHPHGGVSHAFFEVA